MEGGGHVPTQPLQVDFLSENDPQSHVAFSRFASLLLLALCLSLCSSLLWWRPPSTCGGATPPCVKLPEKSYREPKCSCGSLLLLGAFVTGLYARGLAMAKEVQELGFKMR